MSDKYKKYVKVFCEVINNIYINFFRGKNYYLNFFHNLIN